jgi:hypothetical protein
LPPAVKDESACFDTYPFLRFKLFSGLVPNAPSLPVPDVFDCVQKATMLKPLSCQDLGKLLTFMWPHHYHYLPPVVQQHIHVPQAHKINDAWSMASRERLLYVPKMKSEYYVMGHAPYNPNLVGARAVAPVLTAPLYNRNALWMK